MINDFTAGSVIGAIVIALLIITIFMFIKEPYRQKINALIIAAAGGVYWSGGLGILEFPFGPLMLFMAYRGLKDYRYIAGGWMLHTCWDIVHHLYGNPIIPFVSSSSAGCAVCDSILAIWFYFGAPNIFQFLNRRGIGKA